MGKENYNEEDRKKLNTKIKIGPIEFDFGENDSPQFKRSIVKLVVFPILGALVLLIVIVMWTLPMYIVNVPTAIYSGIGVSVLSILGIIRFRRNKKLP